MTTTSDDRINDLRLAQSHLAAVVSPIRGTVRSGAGLNKSLADAADAAAILARGLDADVMALRDLADPRRGVR